MRQHLRHLKNKKTKFIVILVAVAILSASLGYIKGSKQAAYLTEGKSDKMPVIRGQQAIAQGKIIKIDQNSSQKKITLGGDNNQTLELPLAADFKILTSNLSVATKSAVQNTNSNQNDIELNKTVIANIRVENGNYEVVSITYLP